MRIKHPASFFVLIFVMVGTAALSVVWSMAHMLAVLLVLGMQIGLRSAAFHEGHKAANEALTSSTYRQ